jgi:hypothetical protein
MVSGVGRSVPGSHQWMGRAAKASLAGDETERAADPEPVTGVRQGLDTGTCKTDPVVTVVNGLVGTVTVGYPPWLEISTLLHHEDERCLSIA